MTLVFLDISVFVWWWHQWPAKSNVCLLFLLIQKRQIFVFFCSLLHLGDSNSSLKLLSLSFWCCHCAFFLKSIEYLIQINQSKLAYMGNDFFEKDYKNDFSLSYKYCYGWWEDEKRGVLSIRKCQNIGSCLHVGGPYDMMNIHWEIWKNVDLASLF